MKIISGADLAPKHFAWNIDGKVATITINRPERKNPLTFESYAELRDTFRTLQHVDDVKTVVITGAGGNFCSGGDVHEIIGPLLDMDMKELLQFTGMTGDVVKAMRTCPQPIIAAVEGVCAGAGAILAMGSDLRYGTADAKIAFLFTRVGLAGCDMGACSILPRIIGQGGLRNCSTPVEPCRARKLTTGAFLTDYPKPDRPFPMRRNRPHAWPTARPSPTGSPSVSFTLNGT